MRKLIFKYIFSLLMLTPLASNAEKITFTVNVDDVNRVALMVGVSNENLKNGNNTITVELGDGVTMQVMAKQGAFLKSITKHDGTELDLYGSTATSREIPLSSADNGEIFTVKSYPESDIRTASCTVKVDKNANFVTFSRKNETKVSLTEGTNTVRWNPESESPFTIRTNYANATAPIYQVTLDGVNVSAVSGAFTVTPTQGCVIEITTEIPDVALPVVFNYANEESKGAIQKVLVGGKETTDYKKSDFSVKAGTEVEIYFDVDNYKIDSFKDNGTKKSLYSYYSFTVTAATTLDIEAHKYKDVTATLEVADPATILVYNAQSASGTPLTLAAGSNALKLSEKNTYVTIEAATGSYIRRVKKDGQSLTLGYGGVYTFQIAGGERIVVNSASVDDIPTATLNASGLATYSSEQNLTVKTDGVTAYKATVDGEQIKLTALSGYIPAGTGFFLYGTPNATVEFQLVADTYSSTCADVSYNDLSPTTTVAEDLVNKSNVTGTIYALGKGNQMLKYVGEAFVENRAYIIHDVEQESAASLRISFADEATAIDAIPTTDAKSNTKYIDNGRIIIVKDGKKYNTAGLMVK